MSNAQDDTIRWYDTHAEAYAEKTRNVDLRSIRERFLAHVSEGGHILDVGCGSGRDAKVFLDQGYEVTAIDASAEIARVAAEWIGQPVLHRRVEQYAPDMRFDGIWASASLLHLSPSDLPATLRQMAGWLEKDGSLYLSFKQGDGERTVNGRSFTDLTEVKLRALLDDETPLHVCDIWISGDVEGREIRWVNAISTARSPNPHS